MPERCVRLSVPLSAILCSLRSSRREPERFDQATVAWWAWDMGHILKCDS